MDPRCGSIARSQNVLFTLFGSIALLCLPISLPAAPTVTGVVPPLGHPGDIVKINGNGFDPTPSNNIVRFGPNRAAVQAATSTQLTVQVPNGQPLGPAIVRVSGSAGPTFQVAANAKIANNPPNPPAEWDMECCCLNSNSSPNVSKVSFLGADPIYGQFGEFFQFAVDLRIPGRPGASCLVQFVVRRQYRSLADAYSLL
jgi:hypothetical protein